MCVGHRHRNLFKTWGYISEICSEGYLYGAGVQPPSYGGQVVLGRSTLARLVPIMVWKLPIMV